VCRCNSLARPHVYLFGFGGGTYIEETTTVEEEEVDYTVAKLQVGCFCSPRVSLARGSAGDEQRGRRQVEMLESAGSAFLTAASGSTGPWHGCDTDDTPACGMLQVGVFGKVEEYKAKLDHIAQLLDTEDPDDLREMVAGRQRVRWWLKAPEGAVVLVHGEACGSCGRWPAVLSRPCLLHQQPATHNHACVCCQITVIPGPDGHMPTPRCVPTPPECRPHHAAVPQHRVLRLRLQCHLPDRGHPGVREQVQPGVHEGKAGWRAGLQLAA